VRLLAVVQCMYYFRLRGLTTLATTRYTTASKQSRPKSSTASRGLLEAFLLLVRICTHLLSASRAFLARWQGQWNTRSQGQLVLRHRPQNKLAQRTLDRVIQWLTQRAMRRGPGSGGLGIIRGIAPVDAGDKPGSTGAARGKLMLHRQHFQFHHK
jgi:hypothetical protein